VPLSQVPEDLNGCKAKCVLYSFISGNKLPKFIII
jgi:hypothetical protein